MKWCRQGDCQVTGGYPAVWPQESWPQVLQSANQFRDSLRHAMISGVLGLGSNGAGNCERDAAIYLFALSAERKDRFELDTRHSSTIMRFEPHANLSVTMIKGIQTCSEQAILHYVAGVCVHKYSNMHKDCECLKTIKQTTKQQTGPIQLNEIFTSLKAFDDQTLFGQLSIPTPVFLSVISTWNSRFMYYCDRLIDQPKLVQTIVERIEAHEPFSEWFPIKNFPDCVADIRRLLCYFVRMRIHYMCKSINQQITDEKHTKQNRKYKKIISL